MIDHIKEIDIGFDVNSEESDVELLDTLEDSTLDDGAVDDGAVDDSLQSSFASPEDTFELQQQLELNDKISQLSRIHDRLLLDILRTPGQDPQDSFWFSVLRSNTYFMSGWTFALMGLSTCHPSKVCTFLPELIRAALKDTSAIIHILNLMCIEKVEGLTSLTDMPAAVIKEVSKLSREDQRMFIKSGRQLLSEPCELFIDDEEARKMFHRIRQELRARR